MKAIILAVWFTVTPAMAHDIYTGVHGKGGALCCGGSDCALTSYRESGGAFEFLTKEGHWISIPADRITFLPIPGDPPHNDSHAAHLCYRAPGIYDDADKLVSGDGQEIFLYCAFIPPGGI